MVSNALTDPESIQITDVNMDSMTHTWATVSLPAEVGQKKCGSLRCKVDTVPRQSLVDDPDEAMTQNALSTTAEALYP